MLLDPSQALLGLLCFGLVYSLMRRPRWPPEPEAEPRPVVAPPPP